MAPSLARWPCLLVGTWVPPATRVPFLHPPALLSLAAWRPYTDHRRAGSLLLVLPGEEEPRGVFLGSVALGGALPSATLEVGLLRWNPWQAGWRLRAPVRSSFQGQPGPGGFLDAHWGPWLYESPPQAQGQPPCLCTGRKQTPPCCRGEAGAAAGAGEDGVGSHPPGDSTCWGTRQLVVAMDTWHMDTGVSRHHSAGPGWVLAACSDESTVVRSVPCCPCCPDWPLCASTGWRQQGEAGPSPSWCLRWAQ